MDIVRNSIRPIIRAAFAPKTLPSVTLNGIHFTGSTSLYVQLEQVTYIGEIIEAKKEDNLEHINLEIITDFEGRALLNNQSYVIGDYFFKNSKKDSRAKVYLTGSKCEMFDGSWWNLETNLITI